MPEIDYWHWLVLGLALMALEMLAPSTFFLWMGLAAMTVGGLLWLVPDLSLQLQIILFAVLSIVAIGLGRRYLKRHPVETDRPTLNVRGAQGVGRVLTLDAPIVNGVGRVRMDDTLWKVLGPDLPAGTRIEVIGVEGTSLRVRPLDRDTGPSSGAGDGAPSRHEENDSSDAGGDGGGGD
ncbi:MAG TPA: NfeD family protein [Chromatiales bacterium]|nr:NfeD family protein [Chromatiales bacterium]